MHIFYSLPLRVIPVWKNCTKVGVIFLGHYCIEYIPATWWRTSLLYDHPWIIKQRTSTTVSRSRQSSNTNVLERCEAVVLSRKTVAIPAAERLADLHNSDDSWSILYFWEGIVVLWIILRAILNSCATIKQIDRHTFL